MSSNLIIRILTLYLIMKKQISQQLLINSLINIDFLLFKKRRIYSDLNTFNIIKFSNQRFFHCLNPFDLISSLKQFFRVIYFLKKKKKSLFNFFVEGIHQKLIIENFIKYNQIHLKFKIFFKFLALQKKQTTQTLILLKEQSQKLSFFANSLLTKNLFLVQEINSKQIQNTLGVYKIFNNLFDYKKLVFILMFVRQI